MGNASIWEIRGKVGGKKTGKIGEKRKEREVIRNSRLKCFDEEKKEEGKETNTRIRRKELKKQEEKKKENI